MRPAGAPGTASDRYRDVVHVTTEDVTYAKTPTALQAHAIDLLELNPEHRPTVRLSIGQWRHVDRVVRALGALDVPEPRTASDGERREA